MRTLQVPISWLVRFLVYLNPKPSDHENELLALVLRKVPKAKEASFCESVEYFDEVLQEKNQEASWT